MEYDYDSESDDIDPNNYKGIYFDDDPSTKFQDPETGAHFQFNDMCKRLEKVVSLRRSEERDDREQLYANVEKRRMNSQDNPNLKIKLKDELAKSHQINIQNMNIQPEPPKKIEHNINLANANKVKNPINNKAITKNQINFQRTFELKNSENRTLSKQDNTNTQFFKTNAKYSGQLPIQQMLNNSNYMNYKLFKKEGHNVSKSLEKYAKTKKSQGESFQNKLLHNKTMYNHNASSKLGRNYGARLAKVEHFGSTDNNVNRRKLGGFNINTRQYNIIITNNINTNSSYENRDIASKKKRRQSGGGSMSNKMNKAKKLTALNKSNEFIQPTELLQINNQKPNINMLKGSAKRK